MPRELSIAGPQSSPTSFAANSGDQIVYLNEYNMAVLKHDPLYWEVRRCDAPYSLERWSGALERF